MVQDNKLQPELIWSALPSGWLRQQTEFQGLWHRKPSLRANCVTVWCAVSSWGIIGSVFIDGTFTSECLSALYAKLLTASYYLLMAWLLLRTCGSCKWGMTTSPNTLTTALLHDIENTVSGERDEVTSLLPWSQPTLLLLPLELPKGQILYTQCNNIADLKVAIKAELLMLFGNVLTSVVTNFGCRLDHDYLEGSHIEPSNTIFHKFSGLLCFVMYSLNDLNISCRSRLMTIFFVCICYLLQDFWPSSACTDRKYSLRSFSCQVNSHSKFSSD